MARPNPKKGPRLLLCATAFCVFAASFRGATWALGFVASHSLAKKMPTASFQRLGASSLQRIALSSGSSEAGPAVEVHQFQAEVGRVMDIIVNSLYSDRDVFLRELVSNAADACDKKRFLSLTDSDASQDSLKLRIRADVEGRRLIIEDNGVGMTKDELLENLGRIAHSGTSEFVKEASHNDADAISLIGQFGVGFYSSFLVSSKVEVVTRSFKSPESERKFWRWTSDGSSFSIDEPPEDEFHIETSGTKLILHLREDAQEYLDTHKLSELLNKYSEFITFPIELWSEKVHYETIPDPNDPSKEKREPRREWEWQVVNKMRPIWLRNPDEVNQSEYTEFYKNTFKGFDEPLATSHFKVEGQVEFQALMFIPSVLPFELQREMFPRGGRSLRLYVKRVFVNDKVEDIVPRWLAFVRGVVDSEDLPLNVGREILQKSRTLKVIRKRIVRKVLDAIDGLKETDKEKYNNFWQMYGKYFKVGVIEDHEHKDELKRFVHFWSSASGENQTCLFNYVERMKKTQKSIYFVSGESRKSVEIAPAMERMKKEGFEVLYMVDPLDEMCAQAIGEFQGHKFVDISKVGSDLEKTDEEKQAMATIAAEFTPLTRWMKNALGERVKDVKITDRLVDSPATLVQSEWGMSPTMRRYMASQGTSAAEFGFTGQPVLEINPDHEAIIGLKDALSNDFQGVEDDEDMAIMVYESAVLTGGYAIEDPGGFAKRIARFMTQSLSSARSQ